jgi:hypothetical protein
MDEPVRTRSGLGGAVLAGLFFTECIVLLLPLFAAAMARPFGLWDHLTAPDIYHPHGIFGLRSVLWNYWSNLVHPALTVRPTFALISNLQYSVLGGEFWLWYIVKWLAKLACIAGVDRVLREFGVHRFPRMATVSLLLFHPVSFELMLFSTDGWLVFFCLASVLLTIKLSPPDRLADLSGLKPPAWILLFAAWFLAAGTKEAGVVFALCWLALAHFNSKFTRRSILIALPFYLGIAWMAWQLAVTSSQRFAPADGVHLRWTSLIHHVAFLALPIRSHLFTAFFVIAGGFSLIAAARWRDRWRIGLLALMSAWGIGTLLFCSMVAPAPRYMVPVLFALAVPFGVGLDALVRGRKWIAALFAFAFPVLVAGNQYRQALGYQQYFYEASDMLAFAEWKAADGYGFCLTGDDADIPLENQTAIRYYFERYGPQLYGLEKRLTYPATGKQGVPAGPCVLLCRYAPAALLEAGIPGLTADVIRGAYVVRRGGYGIIEKAAAAFAHVDSLTGAGTYATYDAGAPFARNEPEFHAYLIDRRCAGGGCEDDGPGTVARIICSAGCKDHEQSLLPGRTYSYESKPGQVLRLEIPLPATEGLNLAGSYLVAKGGVSLAVAGPDGSDLWSAPLQPGSWHELPTLPNLNGKSDQHLVFSTTGSKGSELSLRNFTLKAGLRVKQLPGFRRYGAIGW